MPTKEATEIHHWLSENLGPRPLTRNDHYHFLNTTKLYKEHFRRIKIRRQNEATLSNKGLSDVQIFSKLKSDSRLCFIPMSDFVYRLLFFHTHTTLSNRYFCALLICCFSCIYNPTDHNEATDHGIVQYVFAYLRNRRLLHLC